MRVPSLVLVLGSFVLGARAQSVAYLSDSNLDQLFTVDLATGAATLIASTANNGLGAPGGLAWKGDTQELWTIDHAGGELGTIDTATGVFTPVFLTGLSGFQGLAWDPFTQHFYLQSQTSTLYKLDPAVGALVTVGATPNLTGGLEIDLQGTLYANAFFAPGEWYTLDKSTGAATPIGAGLTGVQSFSLDEATGVWYAANSNDDALYTVDAQTGAMTFVGFHGAGIGFSKGFEVASSAAPPPPTVYCTAGTTTSGCLPSIGATGTPSAAASSGFTISVAAVEGQKLGLIFYGVDNTGFVPTPWGLSSSFLCVKAPVQRSLSQNSGGTIGFCDGTLSLDWCAFVTANPGALGAPFAAGQNVYAQGWFRDPPSPKSTLLSDGLEFTVVP